MDIVVPVLLGIAFIWLIVVFIWLVEQHARKMDDVEFEQRRSIADAYIDVSEERIRQRDGDESVDTLR